MLNIIPAYIPAMNPRTPRPSCLPFRHAPLFAILLAPLLAPLLVAPTPALAREGQAANSPAVPWLYEGSDVPIDTEWTFGTLANGLRYAVRRNGVPPDQVSVRIRIDAGSLVEQEHERGYAHLLEHLAFKQSRYLGENEAKNAWERMGATFGSDTNAETTPTQTVYKLDLPNINEEKLDRTFQLLSGMVAYPTLSEAGVRSEVPVVLAEMREGTGPGARVYDATRETFYRGQLLASRDPIGTESALTAANQRSVRAFHARWYRPDQTVIVVAGDADPQVLVGLVRKHFGRWRVRGRATPDPDFGGLVAAPGAPVPGDGTPPVDAARVVVEPDLPRVVNYAVLRPWAPVNDTIAYNQGLLIDALAMALINRRLEARARAGGSFVIAQVSQEDTSRSADGTFVSVTPLSNDWRAALGDVRSVIADALQTPPTDEEIAREVAEFSVSFDTAAETAPTKAASTLADDIVRAVDIRETVATPATVQMVFRSIVPLLSPERVQESTRRLFAGTATRVLLLTPDAADNDSNQLAAALAAPVVADGSSRLAAATIRFADLPPIGTPGKLVSARPLNLLEGMEVVTLSNGTRAMLWPNQAEVNRVMVKVSWGQGRKAFAAADAPYISLGEATLVDSGLGSLNREDIDRLATGRKFGFNFAIGDGSFSLAADTKADDLEDQLYLFAAKIGSPRWDAAPFERIRALSRIGYESFQTSASATLERDLDWLTRSRDPRFKTPSPADLAATTPAGLRAVWEPLLRQGPIEVQLFGDFDRATAIASLERTFGALPTRDPLPAPPMGTALQFPAPNAAPETVLHNGDASQAAAIIAWPTAGGRKNMRESRQLYILSQLFSNRLYDKLRLEAGASYSPIVYSNWPTDFSDGGFMAAVAELSPAGVSNFYTLAQTIARDLIAAPPTPDELNRVTEPLRQTIERSSTGNGFWMGELEGASFDGARLADLRSFLNDYTVTSPARMQALAARYLQPDKIWRLQVLPSRGRGAGASDGSVTNGAGGQ